MTTVTPEGTHIRNAVKWISENLQTEPRPGIRSLIREAVNKYDLSPKEGDYLYHFYREELRKDK